MRTGTGRPTLTLCTLNVNGLKASRDKRRAFFRSALSQADGVGVICLQETHHASAAEADAWVQEGSGPGQPWQGWSCWHAGAAGSRGVAVLVHHLVPLDGPPEVVHRDGEGRILVVHLSVHAQLFCVVCVYAPSLVRQRVPFFCGPLRAALSAGVGDAAAYDAQLNPDRRLLVGGDFNCVADPALDVIRVAGEHPDGDGRPSQGYAGGLAVVEADYGLVDVWRCRSGRGQRACTHVGTARMSAARLDRWLADIDTATDAERCSIVSGWQGDHQAVVLRIRVMDAVLRGPGHWCLPLPLLADTQFCERFAADMEGWFLARPLSLTLSSGERWERFKRFVREYVIAHCTRRRRAQRQAAAAQRRELAHIAARVARGEAGQLLLGRLAELQQAAQEAEREAARREAHLAGVLWEDWGEQSTGWFHRLGRELRAATSVPVLFDTAEPPAGTAEDGALIYPEVHLASEAGVRRASDLIADFFDGAVSGALFHPRATDDAAQRDALAALDRTLPGVEREQCEGPPEEEGARQFVTVAELRAALTGCQRGKRPGCDGLPYEFYVVFWDVIGERLARVFNDAAAAPNGMLTRTQRHALIVLLHKKGDVRRLSNYRPIALLCTDYKLFARALALRFGAPLGTVVDVTQTAFLPDRWIGDNVLAHLEEVDYLETVQQPGCVLFLDFEKAYDRIDRGWIMHCMRTLGFGPRACALTALAMRGTTASCIYNGWHTRRFAVCSGVPQGSPLSPLLYVIAAQPLAAMARRLLRAGAFRPIVLPDGSAMPPTHQHADDTTVHAASLSDAAVVWNRAVQPFCRASGSAAHPGKTHAMLLGPHARSGGVGEHVDSATGLRVVDRSKAVRHLGIMLGPGTVGTDAREGKFRDIYHGVRRRASHWSSWGLSDCGRAHVAKQCMASTLVYHLTFSQPSPSLTMSIDRTLRHFIAGPGGRLHPGAAKSQLPWAMGGRAVVCIHSASRALQAKVATRLLHPAWHPWKVLMGQWVGRSEGWRGLHSHVRLRLVDSMGYGLRTLLTSMQLRGGTLPDRAARYMADMRALQPRRCTPPAELAPHQWRCEPLFFSPTVQPPCVGGRGGQPLHPQQFPRAVLAGVRTAGDLAEAMHPPPGRPPPDPGLAAELHLLWSALPQQWRATARQPLPTPVDGRRRSGEGGEEGDWWEWLGPVPPGEDAVVGPGGVRLVVQPPAPGEAAAAAAGLYAVRQDHSLRRVLPGLVPWPAPAAHIGRLCLVVHAPTCARIVVPLGQLRRLREQEGQQPQRDGQRGRPAEDLHVDTTVDVPFLVGPWWGMGAVQLDPSQWTAAGQPLLRYTVRAATEFDVVQRAVAGGVVGAAAGAARPDIWLEPGRDGLGLRDARWATALAGNGAGRPGGGRCRRSRDDGEEQQPAWMRTVRPRLLPAVRAAARREAQLHQHPGPGPPARDWWRELDDVRAPPSAGQRPALPPWAPLWRRLHGALAPREHRFTAWRLLHGVLPGCGASVALVARHSGSVVAARASASGNADGGDGGSAGDCRRPQCAAAHHVEGIAHGMLECPVAAAVWQWVADLWAASAPRAGSGDAARAPPRTAAVLLIGDRRAWDPGGPDLRDRWDVVRLAALFYLTRCLGEARAAPSTAQRVVAQVVAYLRVRMQQDFTRATHSPAAIAVAHPSWLPADRRDTLPFAKRWEDGGALCEVQGGRLRLLLSVSHPVPLPPLPT